MITSKYIARKLWFSEFKNYKYKLTNSFVFNWESDFFAISKSGYVVEVEIKISKSDFMADFKKRLPIKMGISKHDYLRHTSYNFKPNQFYFAFPENLIDYNMIPDEYGIIIVSNKQSHMTRRAKYIHKDNLLENNKFLKSLLDKFYYRNIDLRKLLDLRDYDLKYNQKTILF